ncbi:histone PARylation factor 1 [Cephus cinctus]|uniref:Histone PARylation factor 1 n=1 Tax=Cephus cinctus TaxID=211228 RepID=A0AAJ7RSG8_CEPCN|nr:histone PARylation factor 1 [Cephus cinctus]XP_024946228.1 histone PARylation factor 1 [Cephus cinctus]XP_024946229.1 histone PARylation factor 1 [Cephus cinctus]XP_024946230.1 histone PARylation factor 1 [Cephus cinctus]
MGDSDDTEKVNSDDPRIPCQYGVKCYQKNPAHHGKYKHPPKHEQQKEENVGVTTASRKRKLSEHKSDISKETIVPQTKLKRENSPLLNKGDHELSQSPEHNTAGDEAAVPVASTSETSVSKCDSEITELSERAMSINVSDIEQRIVDKFLVKMPEDFYKFYDFCKTVSPNDLSGTFKIVKLTLVGPYDILSSKLDDRNDLKKEQYLTHWRFYYDPPEFQTILNVEGKDGLHFGYWRDEPTENPVFVATNSVNVNCKIVPVADNIFSAVSAYMDTELKRASPFNKMKLSNLQKSLKSYAKKHKITLETNTNSMKAREKRVVARTLHGAGIVVPYNKKTQVGYRELAVTDSKLRKILKNIDETSDDNVREDNLNSLLEVTRLATIAADECDFGTCLELGHDLFSSGSNHVHTMAIQMLAIAYTHLDRPQFLEIIKTHLADRKRGTSPCVT